MSQPPSCRECRHAFRVRGQDLLCRASAAHYPCDDERSMTRLKALVLNGCGRQGRFFVPVQAPQVGPVAGCR